MFRIAAKVLTICLLGLPGAAFAGPGTIYPLTGPPDIESEFFTPGPGGLVLSGPDGTYLNLTGSDVDLPNNNVLPGGAVVNISDLPGTACATGPCSLFGIAMAFATTATTFTITGQTVEAYESSLSYIGAGPDTNPADNATTTYLSGTLVPGSYQNNATEYGELFTITYDNTDEMTELEHTFASASGIFGPATNFDATEIGDEVLFDFHADESDADMEIEAQGQAPEPGTLVLLGTGLAAGLLRKRLASKKAKA
jgi:hypothetical protein